MTGNTRSIPKSSKVQSLVRCQSLQACPKFGRKMPRNYPSMGTMPFEFAIRRYGCSDHSVDQIGSYALLSGGQVLEEALALYLTPCS